MKKEHRTLINVQQNPRKRQHFTLDKPKTAPPAVHRKRRNSINPLNVNICKGKISNVDINF